MEILQSFCYLCGKEIMQKKTKRRNIPKSDEVLRDFFADNTVFADLFNTCLMEGSYLGKRILKEKILH